MKSIPTLTGACLALVSIVVACGSSGDSNGNGSNSNNATGTSGGADGGGQVESPFGPIGSSSSGDMDSGGASSSGTSGTPTNIEDGGACAAKNADATRKPAYLFFVLDQSSSMGMPECIFTNAQCFDKKVNPKPACCTEPEKPKRWIPITTALESFVADPASDGIQAALELFPHGEKFCDAINYPTSADNLDVKMTTLRDSGGLFSKAIPNDPLGAGTPTRAVLHSIAPIAKKWATDHPDGNTAIVLLTDGLPQQCDADDNIDLVAGEISAVADTVPTYVIGVSDKPENLADLKKLSDAGKTTLTRVDTSDPAKTQKEFLDRINEIRKSTLSCDVSIPPPPDGQTLDLGKINVTFTPGTGAKTLLTYDADCSKGGKSYHFDSVTTPTKISLCTATCDTFEADPKGVVGVEFGCARQDVGGTSGGVK